MVKKPAKPARSEPPRLEAKAIFKFFKRCSLKGATSDDCAAYLKAPHQSVSTRISEMVAGKLLTKTTRRKATRAGGKGTVLQLRKGVTDADLQTFLKAKRPRAAATKALSTQERLVLDAGVQFIRSWRKATSDKVRQNIILALTRKLQAVAIS